MSEAKDKWEQATPVSKSRTINIPPDVYLFLNTILTPAKLDHKASHADMIRNVVLAEIKEKIQNVNTRRKL